MIIRRQHKVHKSKTKTTRKQPSDGKIVLSPGRRPRGLHEIDRIDDTRIYSKHTDYKICRI